MDQSYLILISAGKAQSSYIFNLAISSTSNDFFAFMLSNESKGIFILFQIFMYIGHQHENRN